MERDAPTKILRLQWIMLIAAWLCGAVYVFGNVLAEADFGACFAQYDYGYDPDNAELRPADWPIWQFGITFLRASPVLAVGGALVILPLAIFLLVPRHQVDTKDWVVLVLSVLPLVYFAIHLQGFHDCDRKGSDYFLTLLILWPSQIVFMLFWIFLSVIPNVTRWLVRQIRRP
ncbi:MAG: hypothetical protein CMF75_07935 [Maricaulis sp.]|nr:hypothetical protein [Maricaulis sp.]